MSAPIQSSVRNRLLSLMSEADFSLLSPHLHAVDMPRHFLLAEPDQPITDVYFVESGVMSMVAISPEGLEVEAGLVGREGFASTATVMGADTTFNRINSQIAGRGWKVECGALLAALDASPSLRALLTRFVQTLIVQTACTALSNAVHPIEERLARWILMCDDRCETGGLALTHEFISIMLAVRRPSVTTSLHVLEGNRFIRSERGCIVVTDRRGLEQFAADSYGRPEAAYRQLIGPMQ